MDLSRDRHKRRIRAVTGVGCVTHDHPEVIDFLANLQIQRGVRWNEGVEVCHHAVLPDESAGIAETRTVRHAYDLALIVDAQGFADSVSRKRPEILDATALGPQERMEIRVLPIVIAGQVGEADDLALIVDSHRSVPRHASQVSQVNDVAVLPEQGVLGTQITNRILANTRNADDLAPVIDRRSSSVGVAAIIRELLNLARPRPPDYGLELEDLGRNTGWIVSGVLRPTDRLAKVVDAGGKAVITAQCRQGSHPLTLLPHESQTGVTAM